MSEEEKLESDKYAEKKEELARFYKSARTMIGAMNSLFQQGIERLDFGMNEWKNMDKKPTFDASTRPPPYSYNEKNLYINASNNMWYVYLWQGMQVPPAITEIYYATLLNRIREFKKNNDDFDFNKGIVYANLGVAQSAQMKLDEGFANILKAFIEDYPYSDTNPESSIWRNPLFAQFERQYVRMPLQAMISQLNMTGIASADTFVEGFLDSLNNDQRAFFEYNFIRILQNQEIWNEKENGLTASRLLAYTQDLCLFNEDLLKDRCTRQELSRMNHPDLKKLIKKKFPTVDIRDCGADEMTDLDSKLPTELSKTNNQEKCLRMLLTLRNYSSHNVGGGTKTNYFYAHYKDVLRELVRAMCEIALLPKPP